MAETTNNKIVRLETQMTNIEQKVDDLKLDIKAIASKLDSLSDVRQELANLREMHIEHVAATDKKMEDLRVSNEKEIAEIKKRNMLKGWLYPTLSAISGGVVTFLIISFLKGGKW